jgi:hypothetical protein
MNTIETESTRLIAILCGALIAALVGAAALRGRGGAQDSSRSLLAFLVPLLGCLVIDAYVTFLRPGLVYEPVVAAGMLLIMLFWSVATTERFVEPGRSIMMGSNGPVPPGGFPHFGATFYAGLFVLALGAFLLRRAPLQEDGGQK